MSGTKKLILGILFILLLIYLFSRWNKVMSISSRIVILGMRAGSAATRPLNEGLEFVTALPKLMSESQRLAQENRRLQQLWAENLRLREENLALKNQLSVLGTQDLSLAATQVIGEVFRAGEPLLVLNRGSNQGLSVGQVVVKGNLLIGEIIDVSPWMSLVRPVYAPNTRVPVELINQAGQRVLGIVRGDAERMGEMLLSEVLIDDEISAGDLVETSGALGHYPAYLVVGQLKEVERIENQTHQQATIELPWKSSDLGTVFVYLGRL